MSGKVSRFLMTSIASVVLAACGIETMEGIPSQIDEVTETLEDEEQAPVKSAHQPDEFVEEEVTQIEKWTEGLQERLQQQAINRLLGISHLERDGYRYYFTDPDSSEFIQIEVREIAEDDAEHESLEGVYRYSIETKEILMRDYLTGDFIPYAPIE